MKSDGHICFAKDGSGPCITCGQLMNPYQDIPGQHYEGTVYRRGYDHAWEEISRLLLSKEFAEEYDCQFSSYSDVFDYLQSKRGGG